MPKAISYALDLEREIPLSDVRKKVKLLDFIGDDKNFLYGELDSLKVFLFKNGLLRIVHKSAKLEALQKELPALGLKLSGLLGEIARAAKIRINPSKALSTAHVEDLGQSELVPPQGTKIGIATIREISAAIERLLSEYHAERLAVQAGESLGRRLRAKSKGELDSMLCRTIEKEGFGIAMTMSPKVEESGRKAYSQFEVHGSALSYAMPPKGRAVCHLIRALIRGAYCAYLNQENVNVIETKCWGLGDPLCEFRVYLLTM